MKHYKANHYFRLHEGLNITDQTGETVINIKSDTASRVEYVARKILSELNREYYTKTALLKENDENFKMGLITPKERTQREFDILETPF